MFFNRSNLRYLIFIVSFLCIGCTGIKNIEFSNLEDRDIKEALSVCKKQTRKDQVLCRGLLWLFENPVVIDFDGFLELGEELNLFYKLYINTKDSEERKFFKDIIISRIDYLLDTHELKVDYAGEITAYLNFAKIMKKIGIERPKYTNFITKDILSNHMTYPPNITYSILNSALIEDIGYESRIRFKDLVNQGAIVRFAKAPELIPVGKAYASRDNIMNFFYDITHEVFAVSNFGDRDPKQYLLEYEVEFLKDIISRGISIYLKEGEIDILAELIVCAKMLDYTDFSDFEAAVEFILTSQKKDGSFGIIERMVYLGRPNFYRHGVLVALWALMQ